MRERCQKGAGISRERFSQGKTADPNSFIDNNLIKPLEDSGFIKALYQ
jgi:hypothetical protein